MNQRELPDNKKVDRISYSDVCNASTKRLTTFLIQANKEIVRKDEEIRKLSKIQSKAEVVKKKKVKDEQKAGSSSKKKGEKTGSAINGEADSGVDAILIFPEEIWEKILESVTDWKTLQSCSGTCQLFKKILHPLRTIWKFKEVIPSLYKYLSGKDILKCRFICKAWNEGVDRFLESPRSIRPHRETQNDPTKPPFVTPMAEKRLGRLYVFSNTQMEHIVSLIEPVFERIMGNHSRNPFIGRAVTITEYEGGEIDERLYWSLLYKFLERFGKHIWYLTVFRFKQCSSTWAKKKLFEFLTVDVFQFVPEMRSLRIAGYVDVLSERVKDTASIPPTSKLESLVIDDAYYDDPNPVVNMKRYHMHLGRLHVKAKTWKRIYHYDWPNLTELHVEELESMEEFNSLLKMNLPRLRKLGLSLTSSMDEWTFPKMLEVIVKVLTVSPLTTLRFATGIPIKFMESLDCNLYAPSSLKTLEMEHVAGTWPLLTLSNYTFLLRFPFLENLNLFWRKNPDPVKTEMKCRSEIALRDDLECDYRIYYNSLRDGAEVVEVNKIIYGSLHCYGEGYEYNSNIWELLPRLKVLTFQWKTFTREGYEAYRSEKGKKTASKVVDQLNDRNWFQPWFERYIRN